MWPRKKAKHLSVLDIHHPMLMLSARHVFNVVTGKIMAANDISRNFFKRIRIPDSRVTIGSSFGCRYSSAYLIGGGHRWLVIRHKMASSEGKITTVGFQVFEW
ncbi:hypothetical protein CRG98_035923, partial [Punica granatum]